MYPFSFFLIELWAWYRICCAFFQIVIKGTRLVLQFVKKQFQLMKWMSIKSTFFYMKRNFHLKIPVIKNQFFFTVNLAQLLRFLFVKLSLTQCTIICSIHRNCQIHVYKESLQQHLKIKFIFPSCNDHISFLGGLHLLSIFPW